jgi:transcriptional regulator with XRE-family HTH domain
MKKTRNEFAKQVDKYISERIRDIRIMKGMTQKQLGNQIDVSIQQIQKYEKAINRISLGRLALIAKALGKPFEYFFNCCNIEKTEIKEDAAEKFCNDMMIKLLKIRNLEQQNAVVNLIDSLIK